MPRFSERGSRFTQLAGIAAVTGTAAIFSLPAAAQNTDPGQTMSNPAAGASSSTGTPGTETNSLPRQPGAANGDNGVPNANQADQTNPQPPSQTLPEPKPSDYGASSFNAPSDAELDHFEATHRPPAGNSQNTDKSMENQGRSGSYGGSSIAAPTPPHPPVNQSPGTSQDSH